MSIETIQEAAVGFYSRRIFPCLCDLALDRPPVAKLRQEMLANVSGNVLEIGFGTGLNLPHYPQHVNRITVVDPNPGMYRVAKRRIEEVGIEVDQQLLSSESLPFEEASFDCVVSTFTLCSIEHVDGALAEVYRVLKLSGRFFFLEHGLSPEPKIQKWQRRLNWIERLVAGNCHLDRNVRELVGNQPFQTVEPREFYLEKTPKTHGYIYEGVATKS